MAEREPLSRRNLSFYKNKEIQRSYNFLVRFSEISDSVKKKLFPTLTKEDMDVNAISVELPGGYSFKKEYYNIGPYMKSFPVLEHNGFEFTISFEEDNKGSIKHLIQKLQSMIVNENGYYENFLNSVIPELRVSVIKPNGMRVYEIVFENCYFMKASAPTFSFATNDKIVFDITFNSDHYVVNPASDNLNFDPKKRIV